MTLSILALIALSPQGQTSAKADASAADLIAACFKHYYEAKSVSGRIHLTQSAQGMTIAIDTDVAFERPSKMYILQRRNGAGAHRWLATSDGRVFSYDNPGILGKPRFQEAVVQPDGRVQTVQEMYSALGPGDPGSIGERPAVLDIAISNQDQLVALKAHWGALHRNGTSVVRDQTTNVVTGDYCYVVGQPPTGSFEMYITPDGDVMRYVVKNRYGVPGHSGQTVDVISNYETDLKVGAQIDPKIFQSQ